MRRLFVLFQNPKIVLYSGVLTAFITIVLARLSDDIVNQSSRGIFHLQLAFSKSTFQSILSEWGREGASNYLSFMWLDFIYPIAYALLLPSSYALLFVKIRPLQSQNPARKNLLLFMAPIIAGFCDYIENTLHIYILESQRYQALPIMAASIFALVKWSLIALVLINIILLIKKVKHSQN